VIVLLVASLQMSCETIPGNYSAAFEVPAMRYVGVVISNDTVVEVYTVVELQHNL